MEELKNEISDAELYCRKDAEEDRFYEIFFSICHKYAIQWTKANAVERAFVEEVTRVTYECDKAKRMGLQCDSVKSSFAS